jgi:hypothetical protein
MDRLPLPHDDARRRRAGVDWAAQEGWNPGCTTRQLPRRRPGRLLSTAWPARRAGRSGSTAWSRSRTTTASPASRWPGATCATKARAGARAGAATRDRPLLTLPFEDRGLRPRPSSRPTARFLRPGCSSRGSRASASSTAGSCKATADAPLPQRLEDRAAVRRQRAIAEALYAALAGQAGPGEAGVPGPARSPTPRRWRWRAGTA